MFEFFNSLASTDVSSVMLGAWDLKSFLENTKTQLSTWGGGLIMVIGSILVIYAAILFAKAIMGRQGGAGEWMKGGIALLVGGAMLIGGWDLFSTLSSGGQATIKSLGE